MNSCNPPRAVTKNSSRKELWDELECVWKEVDQQQNIINDSQIKLGRLKNEIAGLRYQITVIRAALSIEIPPG